jgi:hypothetical protein
MVCGGGKMNHIKAIRVLSCFGAIAIALCFVFLVSAFLGAQTAEAQTSPFLISPYYGTTTVSQGYTTTHRAYDYLLRYVPVLAAESGTIKEARWYSNNLWCHQTITDSNTCGFGLHIRMQHPNGYWTIYGHLSTTGFDLTNAGVASVSQKQFIGNSGHTGYSTGPHLHFEVRPSQFGNGINPSSPNLWEDGQWATPSHPIPAPANLGETIVHEGSGGFTKGNGGPFNNSCQGQCVQWIYQGGSPYVQYSTPLYGDNTTPDEWARWQTQGIPANGGFYEVRIHMPTTTISKTWQARYTIINIVGSTLATGVVDQAGLPNPTYTQSQWVSVGTYFLMNGYSVYTTDLTGEGISGHCPVYCQLMVDAVKFTRRPAPFQNYLPLIMR